jgi:hypothetical protein
MSIIGGDNGVSMGGYDYGVATLKYCNISAGSKDPPKSYSGNNVCCVFFFEGVHRLIFEKHKNIKTYLSRPKIPEKY